ncbi:MAG: MCE family protein [Armatimonadetes bacterium]|nr:MCE family protein [Armatimonadota bacterium]
MQSAWKVGLFVVAFGVLLIFAYSLVGSALFPKEADVYYVELDDAGGVGPGAVVTIAGVEIGTVASVRLESANRARMTLHLRPGTFVPKDAVLVIPRSLFALGESRVEIHSEKGRDAGRLEPGGTITRSVVATVLESYLPEGEETIRELNATLAAAREFFSDAGMRERLSSVLDTTEATIAETGALMKEARGLIAENRDTLRSALENSALAVADLRRGIQAVNEIVGDPRVGENVRTMLATLQETAARAEELVANLNDLVTDPDLRAAIETTMMNVEDISRTGVAIAENTRQITADGKVVSAKAIELADRANEIADEATALLRRLSEFVEQLPKELRLPRTTFRLETARNLDENVFQTDVLVTYPVKEGAALYGGMFDITESNLMTLQYGQHYGSSVLRYGIYASKPGIGVDWQFLPAVNISADLFNPNDLRLDVRARLGLGTEWYGWIGVNRLFGANEGMVGIGVKR